MRLGRRGFMAAGLGWCAACGPLAPRPVAAQPAGQGWACGEEAEGARRLAERAGTAPSRLPALNACAQNCPPPAPGAALPGFGPALQHRAPRNNPRVAVLFRPDDPANGLALPRPANPAALEAAPPAVVREVAEAALLAMQRFAGAGLRPPLRARSGLVTIELRSLILVRGWAEFDEDGFGQVVLERSLRGDALRETVAHEIFHLIQYAYNRTATAADSLLLGEAPVFTPMLREGGARVAEMVINPDGGRYEQDAQDWYLPGGASLARFRTGRRRRYIGTSYGAGLFWKYMAEQHAPALPRGADPRWGRELAIQKLLLEATSRAPTDREPRQITIEGLREARRRMPGLGDFDRFLYVNGERDLPAIPDTSWGNFQLAVALNGTAGSDSRFRFEDAARWRGITAGRRAIPAERQVDYADLPIEPGAPGEASGAWGPEMIARQREAERAIDERIAEGHAQGRNPPLPPAGSPEALIPARMLDPFSFMIFRVRLQVSGETRLLRVRWEPEPGLEDAMVQVLLIDQAGEVLDLHRHDGHPRRAMDHSFACRLVSEVLILVASRVTPGNFRLSLGRPAEAAILAIGDWNCRAARAITNDPATHRADWRSRDTDFSTAREQVLFPDGEWRWWRGFVLILVRNRGVARAEGVTMEGFRRHRNGGAWEALTCVSFPATLETDDECRRLDAEAPLTDPQFLLPAPCRYADDSFNLTTLRDATMPGRFLWPGGAPADYLLRFRVSARNDPNGPTQILTSFGASAPDCRPFTPA